jgi:hypothetical protein
MFMRECLHAHAQLPLIAGTDGASRRRSNGVDRSQRHRRQDGDDGNYDEEFHEREGAARDAPIRRTPNRTSDPAHTDSQSMDELHGDSLLMSGIGMRDPACTRCNLAWAVSIPLYNKALRPRDPNPTTWAPRWELYDGDWVIGVVSTRQYN